MQTFLAYKDFALSATCLDNKRCFKQIVECIQILNTLSGKTKGWRNHPASKMWRSNESSLVGYLETLIIEWHSRGYKSPKCDLHLIHYKNIYGSTQVIPSWLDDKFTAAHRSNLLRKNETFYRKYGWIEPTTLEYVWPIQ